MRQFHSPYAKVKIKKLLLKNRLAKLPFYKVISRCDGPYSGESLEMKKRQKQQEIVKISKVYHISKKKDVLVNRFAQEWYLKMANNGIGDRTCFHF